MTIRVGEHGGACPSLVRNQQVVNQDGWEREIFADMGVFRDKTEHGSGNSSGLHSRYRRRSGTPLPDCFGWLSGHRRRLRLRRHKRQPEHELFALLGGFGALVFGHCRNIRICEASEGRRQ